MTREVSWHHAVRMRECLAVLRAEEVNVKEGGKEGEAGDEKDSAAAAAAVSLPFESRASMLHYLDHACLSGQAHQYILKNIITSPSDTATYKLFNEFIRAIHAWSQEVEEEYKLFLGTMKGIVEIERVLEHKVWVEKLLSEWVKIVVEGGKEGGPKEGEETDEGKERKEEEEEEIAPTTSTSNGSSSSSKVDSTPAITTTSSSSSSSVSVTNLDKPALKELLARKGVHYLESLALPFFWHKRKYFDPFMQFFNIKTLREEVTEAVEKAPTDGIWEGAVRDEFVVW